jgi:DNA-binding response OmpR family regulator
MLKRILVIDNDPGILDAMQEVLLYEGYDVMAMEDAGDILPTVKQYQPDLILIDYILNGINGGELCHQVKANIDTCHLPVILMSAYPRVLQSLGHYGFDDFIPKPFDLTDLTHRIAEQIHKTFTYHPSNNREAC